VADDFCKFFDAMMEKYTLKSDRKHRYHHDSTMSNAEIMLIMILFHDSGYYMPFRNFKMPFSEYENGMSKCYP
jgi:hypothetical protein